MVYLPGTGIITAAWTVANIVRSLQIACDLRALR
jgi:hypothetical protein